MLEDAPEAVGNLDHAIDGILNSYHGLNDAIRVEDEVAFEFYDNPLCAFVLRIRNARHHNHANGIRSIHRCARAQIPPANYLLVNYPAVNPNADENHNDDDGGVGTFAEYFISWDDTESYLNGRPNQQQASVAASREEIGANVFGPWCAAEGYPVDRVFINLIPILFAAGTVCTPIILDHIETDSTEAEAFLDLFQTIPPAVFRAPNYTELTSAIFWPI